MNNEDTLRPEYSAELIQSGEWGRYANRSDLVLVEPDLHKLSPDSAAVNQALRQYAEQQNGHRLG